MSEGYDGRRVGYLAIVAAASLDAGDDAVLDLGAVAPTYRYRHELNVSLVDGTQAFIRILHSDAAIAAVGDTDLLRCGARPYEFDAHHRYVHVRALADATRVTVAARMGDGIR